MYEKYCVGQGWPSEGQGEVKYANLAIIAKCSYLQRGRREHIGEVRGGRHGPTGGLHGDGRLVGRGHDGQPAGLVLGGAVCGGAWGGRGCRELGARCKE